MIEIEIPQDIRKYKTKLVGPFTGRNIIGLVIGLALGGLAMTLCKALPGDMKYFIMLVAALPGICIGWISFHSIPFERFVGIFIKNTFLMPKVLKYQTKNIYNVQEKLGKEKKKSYNNKSKNPDYVKYT